MRVPLRAPQGSQYLAFCEFSKTWTRIVLLVGGSHTGIVSSPWSLACSVAWTGTNAPPMPRQATVYKEMCRPALVHCQLSYLSNYVCGSEASSGTECRFEKRSVLAIADPNAAPPKNINEL